MRNFVHPKDPKRHKGAPSPCTLPWQTHLPTDLGTGTRPTASLPHCSGLRRTAARNADPCTLVHLIGIVTSTSFPCLPIVLCCRHVQLPRRRGTQRFDGPSCITKVLANGNPRALTVLIQIRRQHARAHRRYNAWIKCNKRDVDQHDCAPLTCCRKPRSGATTLCFSPLDPGVEP